MRIGASLFLIAIGAILKFAVTKKISGVDISTVGIVLMIVGVIGLLISLILLTTRRRTDVIHEPGAAGRTTYVEPRNYDA